MVHNLQTSLYKELIDPLFPKRQGENVVAFFSPSQEVRQRVVVSAHLDAAYEFNLWYWFKNWSIPIMAIAVLGVLMLIGASVGRSIDFFKDVPMTGLYRGLGIAGIALTPLMLLFVFFHTYRVVDGAMDDLTAVAVLSGLARMLAAGREGDGFYPEQTEVVLLFASSEEAGLRGVKRYAKAHKAEMTAIPTWGLFLDGIYDEAHLVVNRKEISMGTKMDPALVDMARLVASEHGWPIKVGVLPVGATDASAFVQQGIPSVSIGCVDTSSLPRNYHTRYDTIDPVRPESMVVSLQLVLDMLQRLDSA
ncbi:MAG: M28 family metallopeptidase, partial [Candidatus Geothermincolia bacterium]